MATTLSRSALAAPSVLGRQTEQATFNSAPSFAGTQLRGGCSNEHRVCALFGRNSSQKQRAQPRAATVNDDVSSAATEVMGADSELAGADERAAEAYSVSGEWPETFSLLNFEDVSGFYEPMLFKEGAQPGNDLVDVMSSSVISVKPETPVKDILQYFDKISGVPVVNAELRCVGVLSKKDLPQEFAPDAKVGDIMSSPAITVQADKTVSDAAALMLKHKVHRIPVVNEEEKVVGMVTRTDIFTALEQGE